MKRFVLVAIGILSACTGASPTSATPGASDGEPRPAPARPELILSTTTSTQDSGLLDVLIPEFERLTGYRVKTAAVGTGAALAIGARGDADVLLVHAPQNERDFMSQGNGDRRLLVMHNDFVLVGPPSDPAKVRGTPILRALADVAATRATFISRGDNSGTHILEKALWKQASLVPAAPWYVEAGVGMGQTLQVASEKRAYTITDRATYLARKAQTTGLALDVLVQGEPALLNYYHVIVVNPAKFPRVNAEGANAFADYLVSAAGQQRIASFGVEKYGQPLFFADAAEPDPTLP